MRDDRLAWKNGAGFPGSVADGNDDVEFGIPKLVPGFAARFRSVNFVTISQYAKRKGIYSPRWFAAGAWASKRFLPTFLMRYSAKILRAELPVQRNRIFC